MYRPMTREEERIVSAVCDRSSATVDENNHSPPVIEDSWLALNKFRDTAEAYSVVTLIPLTVRVPFSLAKIELNYLLQWKQQW
jgi:hypothetical protein